MTVIIALSDNTIKGNMLLKTNSGEYKKRILFVYNNNKLI